MTQEPISPEQFIKGMAELRQAMHANAKVTHALLKELEEFRADLKKVLGQASLGSVLGNLAKRGLGLQG